MGDQVLIKDKYPRIVNPQRKGLIMPDVMLYTRNVMIPVVKPAPFKHCLDISFSEDKPQILREHNYRNNPALLFSETASHTLSNRLKNLSEVKRINCWKGLKDQSTKYTISGKTSSPSIEQTSISQKSCPSNRFSCKKRNNMLHFPSTRLAQFVLLTNDRDLCQTSSRSIKLSRKCDLKSQKKESQIKCKDRSPIVPRIEASINSMSQSVVSLLSQSFHDYTDSSTDSTLSTSSFNIENKETFANIRRKPVSGIASHYLHPPNSECEINVLHYENGISSRTNLPQSQIQANNLTDKESAIENHHRPATDKTISIKYSWEVDDLASSSQRKEYNNGIRDVEMCGRKPYDCEIKYSWQVIGISTQTSHTLLQDLLNSIDKEANEPVYKMCSIKYSWQIIGTGTQASLHDHNDPDYWSGILLTPNKSYNENNGRIDNNETDCTKDYARYPEERLRKYLILNRQALTFAEKEIQVDNDDCYAKYSWHNLIKRYQ